MRLLSGIPRALKKATLANQTAWANATREGGGAVGNVEFRVRHNPSSTFIDVDRKIASLLA
jgi:hypothetical protein